MAEYKLYYFDFKGRAEVIRLVFALAGQKYEDIRFSKDKLDEYKDKTPFGQVPVLEIIEGTDKVIMAQSISIGISIQF